LYSEVALTKTTYLLFKDKKYQEALPLFQQLQEIAETPSNKTAGKLGAMRCAFYLNQFDVALAESAKVLSIEKLTPQQSSEAKYIKAKSLYETNRLDDAMAEFKAMTKTAKNITGAEAYYYIAKIQFAKQDYKELEKTISKLISYEYSNDDWNNRGMLLFADSYLAKGEDANAEMTLQVIIDNKPKPEFMEEAKKKLEALKAKRSAEAAAASQAANGALPGGSMKVEYNQTKKDSALFNKISEEPKPAQTTTTTIEQPK